MVAGLAEALGGVSSLAGLEQALTGFIDDFERQRLPGCPIGTLPAEVADRNEEARCASRWARGSRGCGHT